MSVRSMIECDRCGAEIPPLKEGMKPNHIGLGCVSGDHLILDVFGKRIMESSMHWCNEDCLYKYIVAIIYEAE